MQPHSPTYPTHPSPSPPNLYTVHTSLTRNPGTRHVTSRHGLTSFVALVSPLSLGHCVFFYLSLFSCFTSSLFFYPLPVVTQAPLCFSRPFVGGLSLSRHTDSSCYQIIASHVSFQSPSVVLTFTPSPLYSPHQGSRLVLLLTSHQHCPDHLLTLSVTYLSSLFRPFHLRSVTLPLSMSPSGHY